MKNNLWLWLGQKPVIFKFFFVSHMWVKMDWPSTTSCLWRITANLLFHILKFESKINSQLSIIIYISYILKYTYLDTYTHKHTCICTYIIMYIIVCLIIQLNLPHHTFILIRIELICFRVTHLWQWKISHTQKQNESLGKLFTFKISF